MSIHFGRSTPILRVSDMARSGNWYSEALGFEREWGDDQGRRWAWDPEAGWNRVR